jgi:DnaJ-class molecular chaperone
LNYKAKYYQVFGLTESASKAEVKRAYRKLAMKYHPDRNDDPKAHKLFLDLTEAYQIIIDDKPRPSETIVSPKRTDKTNEERIKEAQERLRKQTERNKINQEIFIQKLTSGLKFKVFKILAIVSTFLAVILFKDLQWISS